MNDENKYFIGMTPEEIKQSNDAEKAWQDEEIEMYSKDCEFLESLKKDVNPEYFKKIEYELEESENPYDYRFVKEPIGNLQNEGDHLIWFEEHYGYYGEECSGTMCMRIADKKFFTWNYYM